MALFRTLGWDPDSLRTKFSKALSEMYKLEVPLYADLINIVNEVDDKVIHARSALLGNSGKKLGQVQELPSRHRLERHGAIRLGTAHELRTIKRLFAIFGMHPVGYYDLSVVGFPLHATAFRALNSESLAKNPFRVFTTLLRPDLISTDIRSFAEAILTKRNIFTDRLISIIDHTEKGNSLIDSEADELLVEALKIFKWHSTATVSFEDYEHLNQEHPMLADIASFPSAHMNHLTPRTLDINMVQEVMVNRGIPAKESIEGPPRRKCEILLRQTSFKALHESVKFYDDSGSLVNGSHTARFGEVEQRGAAVTRKGRDLYDKLLAEANASGLKDTHDPAEQEEILQKAFEAYPDDWSELRSQGLIFVRYQLTLQGLEAAREEQAAQRSRSLSRLVDMGFIKYEPITYEDFLPFSAAGIFTSNLRNGTNQSSKQEIKGDRVGLERSLGARVADEFAMYEHMEQESIEECRKSLGLQELLV
ncbi:DUF1338 domain protein [Halenospora varia]|nr:DUF1338 domain protein [Halenospora varia]